MRGASGIVGWASKKGKTYTFARLIRQGRSDCGWRLRLAERSGIAYSTEPCVCSYSAAHGRKMGARVPRAPAALFRGVQRALKFRYVFIFHHKDQAGGEGMMGSGWSGAVRSASMAWAQGYKKKNCAHYIINENHYVLYFAKLHADVPMAWAAVGACLDFSGNHLWRCCHSTLKISPGDFTSRDRYTLIGCATLNGVTPEA